MSDRFVVGWNGTSPTGKTVVLYFAGKSYESSDYDSYGTQPRKVIHRSSFLGEAQIFDTFDAARMVYNEKDVWTTKAFVLTVSDKEIFHAKLKE